MSDSELNVEPNGPKDIVVIGGKPFAGVIVNASPFMYWSTRCLVGFLSGRDYLERGFDNREIRTSPVDRLVIDEQNKIYAITRNSAYCLESVDLMAFLSSPEWVDDISDLVQHIVLTKKESKID